MDSALPLIFAPPVSFLESNQLFGLEESSIDVIPEASQFQSA